MQEINFYDSLAKPNPYSISFDHFWKVSAALIVFFFVISMIPALILVYEKHHLISLNSEQIETHHDIQTLLRDSEKVRAVMKIKRSIADYSAMIDEENGLKESAAAVHYRISPYLVALAEGSTPGIWLTEISIQNHGRKINLQGNAENADLIPLFIKSLERQAIFSGKSFKSLQITHPTNEPQLSFLLGAS